MEGVVQWTGLAAVGAILCILVKKQAGEYALLISLATVAVILTLSMSLARPVLGFLQSLGQRANLGSGTLGPVLKTLGLGLLTEIGAGVCQDAGENTIAWALKTAGALVAVYLLLPLMESLMALLEQML